MPTAFVVREWVPSFRFEFLVAESAQHFARVPGPWPGTYSPKDVDTALILGAGFPFFMGGLTPYLREAGYSFEMSSQP